jgi:hypothetical protein
VLRTAVPRALQLTAWSVLSISVAGWLAVIEVLWLPLRVRGVLVPVSVVAAVVGNLLLVELALRWSRSRAVALLPALTWVAVAVAASMRRPEGDLLLIGSGGLGAVGLAFLGLGVLAAAVAVGRALAHRSPSSAGRVSSGRAGSGSGGAR